MGSYFRGDAAQSTGGVNPQAERWSDFDASAGSAIDPAAGPVPRAGLEDPSIALLVRAIQREVMEIDVGAQPAGGIPICQGGVD